MTALQNQYNQLLIDKAKLAETERANRAHESIQGRQAGAAETQAQASASQAATEQAKFNFGRNGPLGILSDLFTGILKAINH